MESNKTHILIKKRGMAIGKRKSEMVKPSINIPTIDLSPFFHEGEEDGKKKTIEMIRHACVESGFFQIANHGVPLDLMSRAIHLSTTFFQYPTEEKLKSKPMVKSVAAFPAGYTGRPENLADNSEYLVMLAPTAGSDVARFNVYPSDPPEFRSVLEEVSYRLSKVATLIESILNDCMGLPQNFFQEYNKDRCNDFLVALRYFPVTIDEDNTGLSEHEDANFLTLVFQDDVGGLEVLMDGQWIPVTPIKGNIVVNIGDVIQVLTNKKFKSPTHRVMNTVGKSRYSYGFFHVVNEQKWVEPLPQFTKEIGEEAKYRGFFYREYVQLRLRNKSYPPPRPEDVVHLSYYAIPT